MAQAWHAADLNPALLEEVLGPSVALLVWMGKKAGVETPNDMRPLQLPTCIRRRFGASLADLLGPAVRPLLSPNQAAKRGG
eukprot:3083399-Pyramimonas_sp.AAC.1